MKRAAHVTSIESVRAFAAELQEFELAVRQSLEMLTIEVRRAVEYFEENRGTHWPAEVRKASDRIASALIDLERCRVSIRPEDRPACDIEKKALAKARARLQHAEGKVRVTQKWIRVVRQEAEEFQSRTARLVFLVDHELPRAYAFLDRTANRLERYIEQPGPFAPVQQPEVDTNSDDSSPIDAASKQSE